MRLEVHRSRVTGLASFLRAVDGGAVPVDCPKGKEKPAALDFLRQYGPLFGVRDAGSELSEARIHKDRLDFTHTTYRQVHQGVPVFSGILKVHQNREGAVVAANGDFYPIPAGLDVLPKLTAQEAASVARGVLAGAPTQVEDITLVIVDPGWYGDPPIGPHLA